MKVFSARFWSTTTALVGFLFSSTLVAQASSTAVTAGQAVTLTATADGTAPFTYQWYKDGAALTGATYSTLTLNSFQAGDTGTYTTEISNSAGTTTTDDALLTLASANVAPVFTTQPATQTVNAGIAVTFSAAASGTPAPTYQWNKDGSAIPGATGASYTIGTSTSASAGNYTVVATNSVSSVTSNTAVLTVNSAPSFTTQPSSQTVTAGGSVTFTAAASGTPSPTFQWKKNGTAITGATSSSYTIASTVTGDAGSYTVVATNSAGTATSNTAALTVNSTPSFTTQPSSQTVTAGGSVTFSAAAGGTPSPTFQWMKNGADITGATSSSYTIASTVTGDAGSYTVVATNSVGAVTSNTATLTVNVAAIAPTISTHPVGQSANTGSSVTFTVVASGTPAPTYKWRKNGSNIAGATSASYTIASVTVSDAATYTVVVTNSAGSITSNGALLTINTTPAFTVQPVSQTIASGGSVTFSATASGTPSPTFQWKKGGSTISGATNASYTIASVTSADAASYTVVATNSVGTATSNAAVLTVNSGPAFTTQPASQSAAAGSSVTFTAAASGTPTPTYQWKKGGATISGATSASYTIASITPADAASYTVVATNSVGTATSNAAVLTVNSTPAFTTQPASQSVTAGSSVTFTAAASGSPTPTYQWKKGGSTISGATSASYTIASITSSDAASYTVIATNSVGTATSNAAVLTVNSAPAFTTQPASQSATAGSSITFTAAASGTPTPTYQWKKGGSAISGATNASYTIASVTSNDAASYTVVATNSVGTATSNAAVLTVNSAPAFTTQPASQSAAAGSSVTFTAAATGTPTPTYQWSKGGSVISGATSASYTIASVTSSDAASYTVVATNSVGSATSSAALLTVTGGPTFITQPATKSVVTGSSVTFTAAATGTPTPTYQWKKGGSAISGATSASYTIASATSGDAGSYTVVATNSVGTATSNTANLTVTAVPTAPVFTTQPASQSIVLRKPVTFTAAASGTPTPTFQWMKDGVAIAGATAASYVIPDVATTDEASYTVVATNSQGTVTSDAAILSVLISPQNIRVTLKIK